MADKTAKKSDKSASGENPNTSGSKGSDVIGSSATKQSPSTKRWHDEVYSAQKERLAEYSTIGNLEVPALVGPEQQTQWSFEEKLGYPGEFPFTRGPQASMYRGRLWTMRQFAGFGSPKDTNERFRYLLSQGQMGLSTAFDMPTLMGYDPDSEYSLGEVGREGVSVSCIDDMEELFDGIDLSKVTTSMTVNCSAAPILAMYFAIGRRRGISWHEMGGTIQNDILKEYIAQKEWICPPEPAVRIVCDMIEFCTAEAKRFHPVSISGYHIREAGATAVQELAFTLYDGITYVEECLKRNMPIDSFAPRLSFFWDVHNDFFEEIAKFRAARRMWAYFMRDRFGAKDIRSFKLRTHAQTAGVSLTAQQPVNNVARVALQGLAAVLGGTQSLHTNSMDETLSLPTEGAVTIALRTQQIIAEESGVVNTVDPLAGSYFVEEMTDRVEREAMAYIKKLDEMGGMLRAIDLGFPQKEIAESAYVFQQQVERGEQTIVGVNKFVEEDEVVDIPLHSMDTTMEEERIKWIREYKAARPKAEVEKHQAALRQACKEGSNIMPVLIEAVDDGITLGEVSDIYREVFGVYRDPGMF
jgi:methylmalonyl-CoA mutase N-terminal domain/subunit